MHQIYWNWCILCMSNVKCRIFHHFKRETRHFSPNLTDWNVDFSKTLHVLSAGKFECCWIQTNEIWFLKQFHLSRSFDYEKNLERHLAKHKEGTLKDGDTEQQKEFVCDQCGKIYGNYKSWFYHVKSHSVIYQCQTVSTSQCGTHRISDFTWNQLNTV